MPVERVSDGFRSGPPILMRSGFSRISRSAATALRGIQSQRGSTASTTSTGGPDRPAQAPTLPSGAARCSSAFEPYVARRPGHVWEAGPRLGR